MVRTISRVSKSCFASRLFLNTPSFLVYHSLPSFLLPRPVLQKHVFARSCECAVCAAVQGPCGRAPLLSVGTMRVKVCQPPGGHPSMLTYSTLTQTQMTAEGRALILDCAAINHSYSAQTRPCSSRAQSFTSTVVQSQRTNFWNAMCITH